MTLCDLAHETDAYRKEALTVIGPIHRRPALERRIIQLLRGAPAASAYFDRRSHGASEALAVTQLLEDFATLREAARAAGMELLGPEGRFVCQDEINILGWIGESQRTGHAIHRYGLAPDVTRSIVRCGARLTMFGMRLSPMTIQAVRALRPIPLRFRSEDTSR